MAELQMTVLYTHEGFTSMVLRGMWITSQDMDMKSSEFRYKVYSGTTSKFDGNPLPVQCKDRLLYPLPHRSLEAHFRLTSPNILSYLEIAFNTPTTLYVKLWSMKIVLDM